MGISALGLSTADWPFVLLSAVSTLCPLAPLFPACAAIGHATTAAIIRTDFRRMNDAPDVSASVCWFKQIGKLEPWALGRHPPEFLNPIAALRFRTLFGPKRKPNSARPGRPGRGVSGPGSPTFPKDLEPRGHAFEGAGRSSEL